MARVANQIATVVGRAYHACPMAASLPLWLAWGVPTVAKLLALLPDVALATDSNHVVLLVDHARVPIRFGALGVVRAFATVRECHWALGSYPALLLG